MSETIRPLSLTALHARLGDTPLWTAIADAPTIVDAAIAIQQIPAPTFAEHKRAAEVQRQMVEIGLAQVETDALQNVYGYLPGRAAGGSILVTAHTDTVFAAETDLAIRRDGTRIYGPGLSDNSISVAALLHLARTLQRHPGMVERPIWFVANTGEEGLGNLRGMRAVVDRLGHEVDAVVVIDAEYGAIVHGGVASRRYRVSVAAPGGHAWGDFGAPSAVHVLARLAARLTELQIPAGGRSSFNIGVIEGGTTINAIAQQASLLLDLRSIDADNLASLSAQVEGLVAATAAAETGVTIRAEVVGERPGGSIGREHPLVQLAGAAYAALGADVAYDAASTDANIPLSRGIPAVCVGMSRGGNAHRLDEYLETGDIAAGMQALLLLILAASGVTPNTINP